MFLFQQFRGVHSERLRQIWLIFFFAKKMGQVATLRGQDHTDRASIYIFMYNIVFVVLKIWNGTDVQVDGRLNSRNTWNERPLEPS